MKACTQSVEVIATESVAKLRLRGKFTDIIVFVIISHNFPLTF